ncbi:hypothetical protein Pla144_41650 [Bythopirellula polymerisocia]|uniref:Uncharacterized protein n=1 Tax=Bythopirellula polymerisocia TaxID=2528003 RepID=A0A5C6CGM1_9BACT|nr:hypothetical protein Pla144_41650 [Bythopirellula polymerisocia]
MEFQLKRQGINLDLVSDSLEAQFDKMFLPMDQMDPRRRIGTYRKN